jgi:DNA-binding NtrC family response regulator
MSERGTVQPIFVVDDEEAVLRSVQRSLQLYGFQEVETCADPRQVLAILAERPVSLLLLDLVMPHVSGEQILAQVAERFPALPVVVVTAEDDVRSVVRCMQLGAADYLVKPVSAEQLVATINKTLEQQAVRDENERLKERFFATGLENREAFSAIVTRDAAMLRMFAYLEAIARGSQPVLVVGETGTGKELVARALHTASGRDGRFVAVNVSGLDDTVFSDTLFGHQAGAFTGAHKERKGLIETAGTGTLFLDEIGDLSEAAQVKLLRLIQEREYHPLGSDAPRRLHARVVAATHRDPSQLRQDLYFRLRSHHVRIPPLRERRGDIPLLVERFLRAAADDLGIDPPSLPPAALSCLLRYDFPGNVRELQAVIHDAVARQRRGTVPLEVIRELTGIAADADLLPAPAEAGAMPILDRAAWKRLERENILAALRQAGWNVSATGGAAELLGMKPSTLTSRMKALGIRREEP